MGFTTARAVLVAVALAGGTAGLIGPTPAGACSLIGPQLTVPATAVAGDALEVSGFAFFDLVGELGAMCDGDYDLVPKTGVVVEVVFTTYSGDRTVSVPVTITEEPGPGSPESHWFGPISVPIPSDATAATVRAISTGTDASSARVAISGATTPPLVATPNGPPPAAPVEGQADFTG